MRVLVVGSGGREHALAWKISRSLIVRKIWVVPGNSGIQNDKIECAAIAANNYNELLAFCKKENVDFVVVGPDQAIADGFVDLLEKNGVMVFGPTKAAGKLEWSKSFAKEVMQAAQIPTAKFHVFTELKAAEQFLSEVEWGDGWVVKADGLALGKGVVVAATVAEAEAALRANFEQRRFGEAGARVVVEEYLAGEEVTVMALVADGELRLLAPSRDHKRAHDGDEGPNTGGMGAYTPAHWLEKEFEEKVSRKVIEPLLKEMNKRGTPYRGVLFIGFICTKNGSKVLEFNARFGDPETQALLWHLDEDILPWLISTAQNTLKSMSKPLLWKKGSTVYVVMAASGYPGEVKKGDAIQINEVKSDQLKIFYAGVSGNSSELKTNGGRVLGVAAVGNSLAEARALSYLQVEKIKFNEAQFRRDIGE